MGHDTGQRESIICIVTVSDNDMIVYHKFKANMRVRGRELKYRDNFFSCIEFFIKLAFWQKIYNYNWKMF